MLKTSNLQSTKEIFKEKTGLKMVREGEEEVEVEEEEVIEEIEVTGEIEVIEVIEESEEIEATEGIEEIVEIEVHEIMIAKEERKKNTSIKRLAKNQITKKF